MTPGASSKLVEQQIRQWELAHREATDTVQPCVALSRLPGTPAAELGQRVAERLGYAFFGIELVDEIARTEHVRSDVVAHLDEHVRGAVDRYLLDLFRNTGYGERDYLHSVGRTLKALGNKGAAVILGRGAPFVLDASATLRVQVVASRASRVARLAAAKGCAEADADRQLRDEEHQRHSFLREFVAEPDSVEHFDLVVNTDHRDLDFWVDVVVFALERLRK